MQTIFFLKSAAVNEASLAPAFHSVNCDHHLQAGVGVGTRKWTAIVLGFRPGCGSSDLLHQLYFAQLFWLLYST